MRLTSLDWTIVAVSIVASFIPALWMARRAGRSTAEFFTSGRAAPWWLIGVSMVATTFSTDTPNLVTNKVRPSGPGWAAIRAECPGTHAPDNLSAAFACWVAGIALVYGALFGAGHLLFGHHTAAFIAIDAAVAGAVVLFIQLPRLWRV